MVIAHGEPASLEVVQGCDLLFRHLEIWTYSNPEPGFHGTRRYLFYSPAPLVPRKLWTTGDPDTDIFLAGSCRKKFDDLSMDCTPVLGDPCRFANALCACEVYRVYQEVRFRQSSAMGGSTERTRLLAQPTVETEDLRELAARFPGIADVRAKSIAVESEKTRPSLPIPVAPTPTRTLTYEEIRERNHPAPAETPAVAGSRGAADDGRGSRAVPAAHQLRAGPFHSGVFQAPEGPGGLIFIICSLEFRRSHVPSLAARIRGRRLQRRQPRPGTLEDPSATMRTAKRSSRCSKKSWLSPGPRH
jgi:hypothetical protein